MTVEVNEHKVYLLDDNGKTDIGLPIQPTLDAMQFGAYYDADQSMVVVKGIDKSLFWMPEHGWFR